MAQNPLMFQKPSGLISPGEKIDSVETFTPTRMLKIKSPKTGKVYEVKWDQPGMPDDSDIDEMFESIKSIDVPDAPAMDVFDMARANPALANQQIMGIPISTSIDIVEGLLGRKARPGVGAAIGNAIGVGAASLSPVGRSVRVGAGLLGAILGGTGGAISAGEDLSDAGYEGLKQGGLQLALGEAPIAAAHAISPTARRLAVWAERNALQPFMKEKEFGILQDVPGHQFRTPQEAATAMAERALDHGYGATITGNRVRAAHRAADDNAAVRNLKVKELQHQEMGGATVHPFRALDDFRRLRTEGNLSATQYADNAASIDDVARRYLNQPNFQGVRTDVVPVFAPTSSNHGIFHGPFPFDRKDFGNKGFFGMDAPKLPIAIGQQTVTSPTIRTSIRPMEFDPILRRTGDELAPQWSKDIPKAEIDARMSIYSRGADELERLDPLIASANHYISQNVPLASTLERATMGNAGIREGAGVSGRGRLFINAALRPPMGATAQALNNLSLRGQVPVTPSPNTLFMAGRGQSIPNLIRAIMGLGENEDY